VKRFRPYILISAGLLLILGGFIYGGLYAGVPYQDPTQEMADSYSRHVYISTTIVSCGVGTFLFGVMAGLSRWIIRRHQSKATSSPQ
jgi:hypothetical protein